jgi:hypothetical protein
MQLAATLAAQMTGSKTTERCRGLVEVTASRRVGIKILYYSSRPFFLADRERLVLKRGDRRTFSS